jgi:hypothetical protein
MRNIILKMLMILTLMKNLIKIIWRLYNYQIHTDIENDDAYLTETDYF